MTKLNIKGIKIYAFHGHFEEEKKLGGHFIVNLEIGFNSDKVVSTDKLEDTIDYVHVIDIVKEQMKKTKNMIESAANEILDELFKIELIQSVILSLKKLVLQLMLILIKYQLSYLELKNEIFQINFFINYFRNLFNFYSFLIHFVSISEGACIILKSLMVNC